MKEKYEKPTVELVDFKFEDVVTTSKIGTTPSGWVDKWY